MEGEAPNIDAGGDAPRTHARRATGLVREVSPFSTFVFNLAAQPTAILIATTAFVLPLAFFPGGSIWLGFAMAFVLAVVLCVLLRAFHLGDPAQRRDFGWSVGFTHQVESSHRSSGSPV